VSIAVVVGTTKKMQIAWGAVMKRICLMIALPVRVPLKEVFFIAGSAKNFPALS